MTTSTHAAAAKAIRTELKKNGIKAKVRSSSFSMGNSVNVTVYNQLPQAMKEIEAFCNRFQYGHFNGMEDIYEYSNRNEDLPQVKFVSVNNEISEDLYQAAWDWMKEIYADMENAPESHKDADQQQVFGTYGQTALWRVLNGSEGSFWSTVKPRVRV